MVDTCAIALFIEPLCMYHVCWRNPSLAVTHGAALLVACVCGVVV